MKTNTLTPELLHQMDAYWRAANYLSVGQIYLYDNPLLKRPLTLADVKRMLLGHWGTTPGQNFIYVHLNRVIKKYNLDMIYVSGPGHGGPAVVGNTYLEGTYSEIYPDISQDEAGLRKLFIQHLVMDTIDRLPQTGDKGVYLKQQLKDKLIEHKQYIRKHGEDMPEIRHWKWGATDAGKPA
jgi:phosphoketolase